MTICRRWGGGERSQKAADKRDERQRRKTICRVKIPSQSLSIVKGSAKKGKSLETLLWTYYIHLLILRTTELGDHCPYLIKSEAEAQGQYPQHLFCPGSLS